MRKHDPGSTCESMIFGSTCRWKALCTVDVAPFDEGAAEPALALRYAGSLRGIQAGRGATEGVRGRSPAWKRGRKHRGQVAPLTRCSALLLARRAVVDTTEVGGTASIVRPPEVGPPSKRGSASRLNPGFGWGYARSARLTPCAREPERSLGARFGRSVAEVGKKHLPSRTRGEPRGEPKLRPGSTSRRRSPDKKRHPGTGERVRARRMIFKVNANRLTRLQDRGSNRWKASWVSVFAAL